MLFFSQFLFSYFINNKVFFLTALFPFPHFPGGLVSHTLASQQLERNVTRKECQEALRLVVDDINFVEGDRVNHFLALLEFAFGALNEPANIKVLGDIQLQTHMILS